jgi:serine/threonine protein kinase
VLHCAGVTRYELLDRIGVGGMAEIFRGKAVAAGGFEKPVAIKRILPHLSQDQRFVELLIAEAKVLSLLKHRNIVQIFDVGLGDDGQYFLVMEFVDGKDVGAVQRALEHQRRRIPFDLVLHVGAEMCEALEHAHTARAPDGKPMSLVHRDVSPSNVLLSRAGEVKLTDFGIAKRAESDPTNAGAVRGKFAYISPEQARNEHLDPRSDVFSVGILLWELLCNRRLFSQLDDMAALRGVRDGVIPRPTEIDPELPPEIDTLLMSALSRDVSRRFSSAGQFGAKLRSFRYSLDDTVGDPATELARIVDSTEQVERASSPDLRRRSQGRFAYEPSEATSIRIRTADAFSARNSDASISLARAVIDRFEEQETRLAQLTGEQLRVLRSASRDSEQMLAAQPPRARRPSGEASRTRAPVPAGGAPLDLSTNDPTAFDEATKLLAPRDRRTPMAELIPSATAPTAEPQATTPSQPSLRSGNRPSTTRSSSIASPSTRSSSTGSSSTGSSSTGSSSTRSSSSTRPPSPRPTPAAAGSTPLAAAAPARPPGTNSGALPLPDWPPAIAPQIPTREATPTTHDVFERPSVPVPAAEPEVAGFTRDKKTNVQSWVLIVGAVVVAATAFALTRLFIS